MCLSPADAAAVNHFDSSHRDPLRSGVFPGVVFAARRALVRGARSAVECNRLCSTQSTLFEAQLPSFDPR
jgi:hypothetical protein